MMPSCQTLCTIFHKKFHYTLLLNWEVQLRRATVTGHNYVCFPFVETWVAASLQNNSTPEYTRRWGCIVMSIFCALAARTPFLTLCNCQKQLDIATDNSDILFFSIPVSLFLTRILQLLAIDCYCRMAAVVTNSRRWRHRPRQRCCSHCRQASLWGSTLRWGWGVLFCLVSVLTHWRHCMAVLDWPS